MTNVHYYTYKYMIAQNFDDSHIDISPKLYTVSNMVGLQTYFL